MRPVIHVASGREWRGGQHQVLLLARALHRRGIATQVITGRNSELARHLQQAEVPVALVPWHAGLDPRVALELFASLSLGAVVHAHDSHAHALADFVTRWRKAPLVVTRRVTFPIRSAQRYRRADALIAISTAVRQAVLAAGVDPARIHLVPDGIDLDEIDPKNVLKAAPSGPPRIVCIAALSREKGIDLLLEAARVLHTTHPAVRWSVIGEGDERAALEQRRHLLGLDGVVELPGAAESVVAVLNRATVAVQPSRSEGLGSAVLQALALGVPVVATDVGGLPDALAHGGGILVPAGSAVELSAAVQRLLDRPMEQAKLRLQGPAAATFFSVDRLVERMLDVYRSLEPTRDIS